MFFFLNDNPNFVIHVFDCRAKVCAWVHRGRTQTLEPAKNWEALEELAITVVEAQGGALNLSGFYYCPPELSALAALEWHD